jgi:hypothetical protein
MPDDNRPYMYMYACHHVSHVVFAFTIICDVHISVLVGGTERSERIRYGGLDDWGDNSRNVYLA